MTNIRNYSEFYSEILNEEVNLNDIKIGDYVLFTKNYVRYNTKGNFGKIVDIKPKEDDPSVKIVQIEISKDFLKNKATPAEDSVITQDGNIIISISKIDNLVVYDPRTYRLIQDGRLVLPELSQRLQNILERMRMVVPDFEKELFYFDMTYIDMDDNRDDVITYLAPQRMKDVPENEKYTSRLRQYTRVGRFLNKMFPKLTEQQLALAVDDYKGRWFKMKNAKDTIQIVNGEDIRYWYYNKRYASGNGTLNNSCMQYKESQRRFDIYCENTEKISMVIMTDSDDKLIARALLWKLDVPAGKTFLDRVYSTEEKYAVLIRNMAKENGWLSYDSDYGKIFKVFVKRDYGDDSDNPYMDTFRYFYIEKKKKDSTVFYLSNSYSHDDYSYEYTDHD